MEGTSLSVCLGQPSSSSKLFSNLTLQKSLLALGVGVLGAIQARDLIVNQARCAAIPEFEICSVCCFSKLIDAEMIN